WKSDGSDEGVFGIRDHRRFAELVAPMGIGPDSLVVAYDHSGGLNAARFGWTLERFGFSNFAILDGGPSAWYAAGHPLSNKPPRALESRFVFGECRSENCASAQDVMDREGKLWDDRSLGEWRRGRIPGAVHLNWQAVLDEEQRLLPLENLRRMTFELGLRPEQETIVYCQGGVRAAHSYYVLKELGHKKIRVYDGSWAEYGDSDFPIER
ncbi:MAG: sulfurtransferase, partial [Candidatus Eremiobacteraeota bacterium]|nr:sulfurtransferase [Candidatus Eremiobacteraeota bacterium]